MTPSEVFILALSLSVMLLFFTLPRAPTLSSWSRRNPRTFPSAAWSVSICLARAPRRIGVAVAVHQIPDRPFHLRDLLLKVAPGATPLLRGVARQLHPIDGEHLSPDQPQLVTYQEHVSKHRNDLPIERRNEIRDRGEVRRAVGRQRHEQDILPSQPCDLAAGGHAAGV